MYRKIEIPSTNPGPVRLDYHGETLRLYPNEPELLPEDKAEKTGKKAIVFAVKLGAEYGRIMDFGQYGANDYASRTASAQDRENYLRRAMNIRNKSGQLVALDPYSKNYWAIRFLWEYMPRINSKYIEGSL